MIEARVHAADSASQRPTAPGRRRGLGGALLIGSLAGFGLLPASICAQANAQASEASVKAAYLHKFLAYVEWPPTAWSSAEAVLEIGVMGASAVAAELDTLLVGRHLNGRRIVSRVVTEDALPDKLQVLFVGRDADVPRVLQRLQGRPTLLVTESSDGLAAGAMLNFLLVDGRVRFEAAPATAERAGLKLGARLLAVAERVLTR